MTRSIHFNQIRRIGLAAGEKLRIIPPQSLIWKAKENNPLNHTSEHEGLFYQLPADEKEIASIFGFATPYDPETTRFYKTLGIMPIMIRKPALTAINYANKLESSTTTKPNVRILFYGDAGHGKTHTLVHLLHYLHSRHTHFIIQVREMRKFTRSPWEHCASTSRPGRIDTPLNAAILLQQFRVQNAQLIEKYKDSLVCHQDYKWSIRETTKAGEPIFNVAEHGVNRVNHASDCVAVLFKELIMAADQGKIKLATLLDDVEFLFKEEAGILRHADYKKVLVDEITVARAIKKLIKGSYGNGLTVATLDEEQSAKQNQTPRELLGVDGWNHFDPCLPINVPKYSRKEFESCMNMYQDLKWLARPESHSQEVRDEVRFISALNPGQVFRACKAI